MSEIRNNNIIKDFNSGLSVSKIAKKYNLSRQGIYNILNKYHINYKKPAKKVNIDEIRLDLKRNSINNIVKKHDISYHTIRKIMNENNLSKNKIMKDILKEDDVRRLYCEQNLDDEKIGKIFGCSPYTVRSFRWMHGIYDKNRRWMDILTKDKYFEMKSKKMTLKEVSEVLDIPYYIVVSAKKKYENNINKK